MANFFIIFILLVNTNSVKINNTLFTNRYNYLRIQDGHDIQRGEYSFVIILSALYHFYGVFRLCTGSMITEEWGLTAAHCKGLHYLFYAWYGNFTESPFQTKLYSKVLEMITHPSFRSLSTNKGKVDLLVSNDICLFRVYPTINIQIYGRLSSIDRAVLIGFPVTYVGGGMTTKKRLHSDLFRPLQIGEGAIITCDKEMRSKSKYVMCITPKCSKRKLRPWYGDSGGPLIYDGMIIGVCSYGIESDIITRSGYAPVSPYLDWIYDVMHTKNISLFTKD